ncbi:MAG: hypothetical protein V4550_00385 [Gemmatimonadota bacterium]
MIRRWQHVALPVLLGLTARTDLLAQELSARPPETVLFVCEHGTVKSLLAKVLFEQYAADAGLRMRALSRGTRADSLVPEWMQKGLHADHVELGTWHPQTLRPADLRNAAFVVSFDVLRSFTAGAHARQTSWDGLPSVSADYANGRDAIKLRVRALVDSLVRVQKARKPRGRRGQSGFR